MQNTLLKIIQARLVNSAHDVSDGGLAVSLAECSISNKEAPIGASIKLDDSIRTDCLLFGETQSRVIVSCSPENVTKIQDQLKKVGIACNQIGTVGGEGFKINDLIDLPLSVLSHAFFDAMPEFMERVK